MGLPKKEIWWVMGGVKNAVGLPKKEILMGDGGSKKCSRITKKGNFDGWYRG